MTGGTQDDAERNEGRGDDEYHFDEVVGCNREIEKIYFYLSMCNVFLVAPSIVLCGIVDVQVSSSV